MQIELSIEEINQLLTILGEMPTKTMVYPLALAIKKQADVVTATGNSVTSADTAKVSASKPEVKRGKPQRVVRPAKNTKMNKSKRLVNSESIISETPPHTNN